MSIIVTCLWCDHTETGTGYAPHDARRWAAAPSPQPSLFTRDES